MFWDNFIAMCNRKGVSANTVTAAVGLSNATATKWKNGAIPKGDALLNVAEFLGTTTDFLLTGKEAPDAPVLKDYFWDHAENSPEDKLYNTVCRTMYAIHGKSKGAALLSAIKLPADKPVKLSAGQLSYLATKSSSDKMFFEDPDLSDLRPSELKARAREYSFSPEFIDVKAMYTDYPEAEQWENDYSLLFYEAHRKRIETDCFEEMTETLARFRPNEQAKIMALFLSAVEQYENKANGRIDKEFSDTTAERDESAS